MTPAIAGPSAATPGKEHAEAALHLNVCVSVGISSDGGGENGPQL